MIPALSFHAAVLALLASVPAVLAQESQPTSQAADAGLATITEKRVKEVLGFLASDELLGRDTPSPGLTVAGEYLAARYRDAKLQTVLPEGSWFHEYSLKGTLVDSTKVAVRWVDEGGVEAHLAPDQDVRILRASGSFASELGDVDVLTLEEWGKRAPGFGQRARRPVLVLVGEKDLLWGHCAGARGALDRGGAGEAPVLLVRKAALGGRTLAKAAISVPAREAADLPLRNVMAMLPGDSKKDEIVLVSSHYDHIGIGGSVGGDAINNGADDDASGTTAVVLLAEALRARGKSLPRSLVFVNFSGEEKGLRGSAAFAAKPPFPLEKVVCNLNIEMIGRPAPGKARQAWLTGRKLSDLEAIVAPALQTAGIAAVEFEMEGQLFFQSDNLSFARKGVVAHSISAGHLHRDYHRPSDEIAKIDTAHMTAVIRGLYHACVELASRDAVPSYNEAGRTLLKR